MGDICYLAEYTKCGGGGGGSGSSRSSFCDVGVERLRKASISRKDGLHELLPSDNNTKYRCHKNCISTYASKHHIKRSESGGAVPPEPPSKRRRRSEEPSFSFKEDCLFCGDKCLPKDPRHPDRWRRVVTCRTADRGKSKTSFKDALLKTCDKRNDKWADEVRGRVMMAVSDLHAADAQYHKDCLASFLTNTAAPRDDTLQQDNAFDMVVEAMTSDTSRIWNSTEIEDLYAMYGGEMLTRRMLIRKLGEHLAPDLLILSGDGVANILLFKSQAASQMKVASCDEDDDIETLVTKIAKKIKGECAELRKDPSTYDKHINAEDALQQSSPTLLFLLSQLTSKLDGSLPAAMIGNIVTACTTNKPTSLQIALGVGLRDKKMIEIFHGFGVTSTYDEVLCFKASAAHSAAKDMEDLGISDSNKGLIQVVADNFDANISSPNGLQSTHALAILVTQTDKDSNRDIASDGDKTMKRLKKQEMAEELPDLPVHQYEGPKKPEMPETAAQYSPLPLKVLVSQIISLNRAKDIDFQFMRDIASKPSTPEFNGYNTKLARTQGHNVKGKTKAVYLPLVDMAPADPTTMMTAMVEAQGITNATGQEYTIFTNDQQLYKVGVNITWVYQDRFINFIPRLGGMHTVMNFIGAVGTLMQETGLEEIMETAFGGVTKMLSGKKYPQNMRALRIVVEELLHDIILQEDIQNYSQLMDELEDRTLKSRTTKVWVDNLVKPVFLMMMYVRAEREADWPLHLLATKHMMPYFFAAGHFNYARYCLYYLRSMTKLPDTVLTAFLSGEHVMRHQAGVWNAIWSDQYIESTFMRYGHSPDGIIGITLKPSTLKKWALGLHICTQLKKDVAAMVSGEVDTTVSTHKEESSSRIRNDSIDRTKIQEKLSSCIHPLNPESHPDGLTNIVTGCIYPAQANVDQSLHLGEKLMEKFVEGWPQSFHKPLVKPVQLMSMKHTRLGDIRVYDTSLIYSRVLCLQNRRDIQMTEVLSYELAAIPPSMFDEKTGDMRISTSKSTLKNKLQKEVSSRTAAPPDATVLDGCALLWVVKWPAKGTMEDYIKNFVSYISKFVVVADTYLVFDRYYKHSIKDTTRKARAGKEHRRKHQLSLTTPLPSQKVCLAVTENKSQLIELICQFLCDHIGDLPQNDKKLLVTGADPVPAEICNGQWKLRPELRTLHEEADVIIVQQVDFLAGSGKQNIKVVADDTDIFILLLHAYHKKKLTCKIIMAGTSSSRTCCDIKDTAEEHSAILPDLLAGHGLTGCDTVSTFWSIGKTTMLKTLKSGVGLSKLGCTQEPMDQILIQATKFMASCYGFPDKSDMTSLRYAVWSSKMGNHKLTSAPELRTLPPTTETFEEHVHRAHLQVAIWRSYDQPNPPNLNPKHYGWALDADNGMMSPIAMPLDVSPAPVEVLKMIKCGCTSCSTVRCSCSAAQLSCSVFCGCHGDDICNNKYTSITAVTSEDN